MTITLTPRERFDALPKAVRTQILDKHRHWNVEHHDWWDAEYDCFKQDMEAIGITVDKIYFSGFWSQGDGACFEGYVHNWSKFLGSLGYTDPCLIRLADDCFSFDVSHSGHYYHENCTRFSSHLPTPDTYDDDDYFLRCHSPYEDDSLHEAVWLAALSEYDSVGLDDTFTDAFKDHMRDLYRRLEAEYEYLTSDEAILDTLECNDQLEDAIDEVTKELDHA